jgi:hypothetical protein
VGAVGPDDEVEGFDAARAHGDHRRGRRTGRADLLRVMLMRPGMIGDGDVDRLAENLLAIGESRNKSSRELQ